MKKESVLLLAIAFMMIGGAFDAAVTILGVATVDGYELNPLMGWLLNTSVFLFFFVKTVFIGFMVWLLGRRAVEIATTVALAFAAVYSLLGFMGIYLIHTVLV